MAKWEDFYQLFASTFKKLTDEDGAKFYREFVERSDWDILKQTIEQLGKTKQKENGYKISPKLPEIKAVYFHLLKASKDNVPIDDNCSCCEKTGSILIVERLYPKGRLMYSASPQPVPFQELGIYSTPCSCAHGFKSSKGFSQIDRNLFALNSFGPASGSDFKAREFIKECGIMFKEKQLKEDCLKEEVVG